MAFLTTQGQHRARIGKTSSLRFGSAIFLVAMLSACDDGSGSGGMLDSVRQGPGVLKGTIYIEPGSRIDRDTALSIEEGTATLRDDVNNPQYDDAPLGGTITLGGYVSGSGGRYASGFSYPVDERDVFRLDLEKGETVSIEVFPALGSRAPELEFELREVANGGDSQQAEGAGASLVATEAGTHELTISTRAGDDPARYILRVEQTETTGAGAVSQEFVPGEAVVTTEAQKRSGQIRVQSQAPISSRAQTSLGANRFHVTMPDARQTRVSAQSSAQSRAETLRWIRELRETEGVASASPNFVMESQFTALGAGPRGWHHEAINLRQAWEEATGEGVGLAVLDTGVLRDHGNDDWHPGLASNINCSDVAGCFDAVDGDHFPEDISGDFHGTHVAGIAAAVGDGDAATDPGEHLQGVAYDSDLIPVRVLGGSQGTLADVIAGVDWVVNDGNPRADIMNLSLGGLSQSLALESALQQAEEAGVLVTAAAGNRGDRLDFFPAAYPTVFAVGSVDCDRERSGFSSFGDWLTLSAPGGGRTNGCDEDRVYSTSGNEADAPVYHRLAGTSMAAPQLAGVLALMIEQHGARNLRPEVVRAMAREGLLTDTGANEDGFFGLQTGRGILDAEKAVIELDPESYAALVPSREWLRLSDEQNRQSIAFHRVGDAEASLGEPSVTVVGDPDWLQTPVRNSDGEFEIALSDQVVPGRAYQGLLNVSYASGAESVSYQIPVSAITGDALEKREAGVHFVQLIREEDWGQGELEPALEQRAEYRDGQYEFQFDTSDLEPGNYMLIAGSDIDNNGFIGEEGEAYAVWTEGEGDRSFAMPDPIEVTPDMERSVDMSTSFVAADDTGTPATLRHLRNRN